MNSSKTVHSSKARDELQAEFPKKLELQAEFPKKTRAQFVYKYAQFIFYYNR